MMTNKCSSLVFIHWRTAMTTLLISMPKKLETFSLVTKRQKKVFEMYYYYYKFKCKSLFILFFFITIVGIVGGLEKNIYYEV